MNTTVTAPESAVPLPQYFPNDAAAEASAAADNAFAVIRLDCLASNLRLAAAGRDPAEVIGVVKADAYNHGADVVAEKLYRLGVRMFAVANLAEALLLRDAAARFAAADASDASGAAGAAGVSVLVLGPAHPQHLADAAAHDIALTVESLPALRRADDFTRRCGKSLKLHLALNTGMNRIGFDAAAAGAASDGLSEELRTATDIFRENPLLIPEGIFSHFCVAAEDPAFTAGQYAAFDRTVGALAAAGLRFRLHHLCNSAGTLLYPTYRCDKVRFGIGLYGYGVPACGLLPVMSFHAHITHLLDLRPGDGVGYGLTFHAEKPMRAAVVSAGYADGVNRLLSNRGDVLIRGRRAPIVGMICMDMTIVDVTGIPEAALFDKVTFFGTDGSETITAEDIALLCGTIPYEILCGIGKRVRRIYVDSDAAFYGAAPS